MLGTQLVVIPAVIPINTAVSAVVDLAGYDLVGISMPAAWTAASLTFQASGTSAALVKDMYDAVGTEYTVTAAAARFIAIPPADFLGVQWLIVRSGTTGTPVNQAAAVTINLIVRPVA